MSLEVDDFFYMEDLCCKELSEDGAYRKLVDFVIEAEVQIAEMRGVDKVWVWITPESFA